MRYNERWESAPAMSSSDPLLHDFPDRAIRSLLQDLRNLRELLAALLPELVDRFHFAHLEALDRFFGEETPPARRTCRYTCWRASQLSPYWQLLRTRPRRRRREPVGPERIRHPLSLDH